MPNPGATITIQVQALTDEANAKIQSFFNGLNGNINANIKIGDSARVGAAGLKELEHGAEGSGEALTKVREASILTRESFHALELGSLALGGGKLPELAEGFLGARLAMNLSRTAAMLTGLTLTELLVPVVAIASALLPTGVTAWQAYKAGMEETESESRALAQSQELVARNLDAINVALKKGLISPQDFAYIEKLLDIGSDSALKAAQARMAELGISHDQIANYEKLLKLEEEMRVAAMSRFDQEREKAQSVFEQQMVEIAALAEAGKLAADKRAEAEQLARNELTAKGDAITAQQQAANKAQVLKEIDDELFFHEQRLGEQRKLSANDVFNYKVDKMRAAVQEGRVSEDELTAYVIEQEKLRVAGVKEETKALAEKNRAAEKDLQIAQEIARAKIQGQLTAVQSNPFLTAQQKQDQSVPLMQELQVQNLQRIVQLQIEAANNPATRIEAEKQITDLMSQQAELQNKIALAQHPWAAMLTSLKSEAEITMTSLAATFKNVFQNAISSISNGITGVIMGTMRWKQALQQIETSILTNIVQAIVQMGVRWLLTQALMAAGGRAIMAGAIAASAPLAAAQSGIWATPATLATIATLGAAAAAAPGEILAANLATLAFSGFRGGGYTGDGSPSDVAGVVHGREYVIPASVVSKFGLPFFDAIRSGAVNAQDLASLAAPSRGVVSPASGGGASGGSEQATLPPKVVTVFDRQSLMEELKKPDYAHITVHHVMANKTKLGIAT